MKMFVWNNLWSIGDYGPGTVCVLAFDKSEAIRKVEEVAVRSVSSYTAPKLISEVKRSTPEIKEVEITWGSA